ncbi:MAG: carboxypeptidase regulatory-like domain-containing protein [Flavobacteriales bacterium]|nr:MAG: carboxypeptidase regulatory-like domain-containing protein [Flavobacteriales bacterium]
MKQTNTPVMNARPTMRLLLLLSFLLPLFAQAQHLKQRMAEKALTEFDYPLAASIYEDIVASGKADASDLRALSKAYTNMGEWAKAEATYKQVMTGATNCTDMMRYGDLLRANGKYSEAITWYQRCNASNADEARAAAYAKDTTLFTRLTREGFGSTVRTIPINSPMADLGVAIMDDLLIFSSARGEGVGGTRSYAWDHQPFLNLYTALLKGNTADDPLVMRKDVNSRYHDGTVTYDSLAHRLYFTRNNWYYGVPEKADNGELKLGIYYCDITTGEYNNKEWGNLVPFDHNDKQSNTGHPCVSRDGRRIYFASDRPGGQGGTDIWFCDNLGGKWGVPQNMGPKVNTSGDEMHPFIGMDSTLYFASTGHPGLGGMDIFMSRLTSKGPGRVLNMGAPLNSRTNDHGLVLLRDDSTGFFVSDRTGGKGSDDIYGTTVRKPGIFLKGIVVEKGTNAPIDGSTVVIKDAAGNMMSGAIIEMLPGGKFTIEVPYEERYTVAGSKNGYLRKEVGVDTENDDLDNIVIELEKYDYGAEGTVTNANTGEKLTDALVVLMDAQGSKLAEMKTGADGRYTFPLKPENDYRISVEKDGFFKQSARISTKGKPNAVIVTDFKLVPLEVGATIRLENIYYDLAKWNIRKDAAVELDKLVATLMENPTVTIELSSHTDCRGKDQYNMDLSTKRAKSAVEYLVKNGIAKERVQSKGYGETKPSETCECTKCNDDQHQRNRRTEFTVLSK